jgi:hypothetical protein
MTTPSASPTPPDLTNAIIVDALNGVRTMNDLRIKMDEYRDEGYDVFFATNPATGNPCLWRKTEAS